MELHLNFGVVEAWRKTWWDLDGWHCTTQESRTLSENTKMPKRLLKRRSAPLLPQPPLLDMQWRTPAKPKTATATATLHTWFWWRVARVAWLWHDWCIKSCLCNGFLLNPNSSHEKENWRNSHMLLHHVKLSYNLSTLPHLSHSPSYNVKLPETWHNAVSLYMWYAYIHASTYPFT